MPVFVQISMASNFKGIFVVSLTLCSNFDMYRDNVTELQKKIEFKFRKFLNHLQYDNGERLPRNSLTQLHLSSSSAKLPISHNSLSSLILVENE